MDRGEYGARESVAGWVVFLALVCFVVLIGAVVRADSQGSSSAVADGLGERRAPASPGFAAKDEVISDLLVKPAEIQLAEAGGSAVYQVVLARKPSAPVIVTIKPDDQTTVNFGVAVFDGDDWDNARDITVTAIDDEVAEGTHESKISHSASSLDPTYSDLGPIHVTVTIEDNDTAGIVVSPTSLTVAEPDGTAAFTVTLLSEPMWDVDLPLNPSNSECNVSPKQITLDSGNWRIGARVTVSARDDNDLDGRKTCVIQM
jgi:hypothetical protein